MRFTGIKYATSYGMSMRQQANAKAKAYGAKVVSVSSHTEEKRLLEEFGQVEFYGPTCMGSKTRLFICK